MEPVPFSDSEDEVKQHRSTPLHVSNLFKKQNLGAGDINYSSATCELTGQRGFRLNCKIYASELRRMRLEVESNEAENVYEFSASPSSSPTKPLELSSVKRKPSESSDCDSHHLLPTSTPPSRQSMNRRQRILNSIRKKLADEKLKKGEDAEYVSDILPEAAPTRMVLRSRHSDLRLNYSGMDWTSERHGRKRDFEVTGSSSGDEDDISLEELRRRLIKRNRFTTRD